MAYLSFQMVASNHLEVCVAFARAHNNLYKHCDLSAERIDISYGYLGM